MIPFKEVKHPDTGATVRVAWDIGRARIKQSQIREKHRQRLIKGDAEKAAKMQNVFDDFKAKFNDDGVLSTVTQWPDGVYVIDPLAARIKHSGADLKDGYIPEWYEFCSKPQNEADVEYPMPIYKSKAAKRRPKAEAAEAAATDDETQLENVRMGIGSPPRQKSRREQLRDS